MKKILSISVSAMLLFGFAACKKNNSATPGTNPFGSTTKTNPPPPVFDPLKEVGSVPGTFTKKVLIEEFTGEWCPACPSGSAQIESIMAANPGLVYAAAIHCKNGGGDPYEPVFFNQINALMGGISAYPSGIIDRKDLHQGAGNAWATSTTTRLGGAANIGLALVSKSSGDAVNLKMFFGHNAPIPSALKYTIYLTEDNLDGANQAAGPSGYMHQHVLRTFLNSSLNGDDISLDDNEKYRMIELKNLNISGMYTKKENLKIIVFVHTPGNLGDPGVEILNVQGCSLDEIKKWN